MRLPLLIAGLFACLVTDVAATALTYKLAAHEKACFHATTKKDGEKVAFYFAVSSPLDEFGYPSHFLTHGTGPIGWLVRCRLQG